MGSERHHWAIVLAAGEGSRLRALTTGTDGVAIPKQFCSFDGRTTLAGAALERAERLVARDRVAMVVAAEHRRWSAREFARRPHTLAIEQPANRGTAPGILLPVLEILARDRDATVLVLPSDHHVEDEAVFTRAAAEALRAAERVPGALVVLGATPEDADPELGWILPGALATDGLRRVDAFVEKPPRPLAEELLRQGGAVNTFVFAVRATTLVELCADALPGLTSRLRAAVAAQNDRALVEAYGELANADFSHTVLAGSAPTLRFLPVPPCGWSDLGTPARVAACVRRWQAPAGGRPRQKSLPTGTLAARAVAAEARRRFDLAF